MPSGFPASLDSFTDPSASDTLGTTGVKAFEVVALLHDAVEKLEAKVGIDSSADTTSLDYKVANRQPLDADLTAIAALTTTAYGRGLLTDADAAAFTSRLTGLLDSTYQRTPPFARKTSNETVNNSTTLQDDDALTLAVAANTTYEITGLIVYSAAGAADFKMRFSAPAGMAGFYSATPGGTQSAGSLLFSDVYGTALTWDAQFDIGGAGLADKVALQIQGVLVLAGTAGNLTLQWAQLSAAANDATVYANSFLAARKVG